MWRVLKIKADFIVQIRIAHACVLPGILVLMSCMSPPYTGHKLPGVWTMEKVYEYDLDVTAKHNPQGNRWIEFRKDGSFVSGGEPFGRNTGKWNIDSTNSILYIDSDVDDDDSEWRVEIKHNQMTWRGIGHPRKENTLLVHKRASE